MASTFKRRSGGRGNAASSAAATAVSATITNTSTDNAGENDGATWSPPAAAIGGGGIGSGGNRFLRGTKPWTGGLTLTSSGLRDLDNLLGAGTAAGQPLGTCIWLEQDRWTHDSLSQSLVRYWCAEAISHGQHLVIPIDTLQQDDENGSRSDADDHWNDNNDSSCVVAVNSQLAEVHSLLDSLPRNLHWDRQQQKAAAAAAAASNGADISGQQQQQYLDTLQEEEGEEDQEDDAEQGLQIAWQYRKSVQRELLGHEHASSSSSKSSSRGKEKDVFCHSFDLQGRLKDQVNINQAVDILLPKVHNSESGSSSTSCGFALYRQIQAKLQELLLVQPTTSTTLPRQVVRLLFYHSNPCLLQVALPLVLAYIRHYHLPVVCLIAICPWKEQQHPHHAAAATASAMRVLRRVADVVLETEGFASRTGDFYPPPPEFRTFQGLLRVVKMSTVTAATAVSASSGTAGTGGGGGVGGHFADRTIHKGPAADLYGLKRDRRKLHIQLLHIPPEDYAQGGGSVGGGGVRSGAGRVGTSGGGGGGGCGSGAPGGGSSLDF